MMPPDALATLAKFDAIYLGAIGWPTVPDHVSLWGCLLPIRKTFDQYVNLRPVRLPPGVRSPLADRRPDEVDMLFIRENTEGEYSGTGGRVHVGTPAEVAVEVPVFTRRAIERCARYALDRARGGSRPLDVGASPWVGARHRRPGPRQPRGSRLVGGHDASAPGLRAGGGQSRAGHRLRLRGRPRSHGRPGRDRLDRPGRRRT